MRRPAANQPRQSSRQRRGYAESHQLKQVQGLLEFECCSMHVHERQSGAHYYGSDINTNYQCSISAKATG